MSITEYVNLKRSIYREYSRSYDEDRQRFVSAGALSRRIGWALQPLAPGKAVLDLGCGTGELLLRAHQHIGGMGTLVGLDLTPEMLSLAGTRLGTMAGLVQGNATGGLPYRQGSFDLVTSLNLLQELPVSAIQPLLGELQRVIKPCGALRLVIPCMVETNPASQAFREMAHDLGAMEFLAAQELKGLLSKIPGFVRQESWVVPSPAASAAASGQTRFTFFTQLLQEIKERGLDPAQVKQGVLFFAAQREPQRTE